MPSDKFDDTPTGWIQNAIDDAQTATSPRNNNDDGNNSLQPTTESALAQDIGRWIRHKQRVSGGHGDEDDPINDDRSSSSSSSFCGAGGPSPMKLPGASPKRLASPERASPSSPWDGDGSDDDERNGGGAAAEGLDVHTSPPRYHDWKAVDDSSSDEEEDRYGIVIRRVVSDDDGEEEEEEDDDLEREFRPPRITKSSSGSFLARRSTSPNAHDHDHNDNSDAVFLRRAPSPTTNNGDEPPAEFVHLRQSPSLVSDDDDETDDTDQYATDDNDNDKDDDESTVSNDHLHLARSASPPPQRVPTSSLAAASASRDPNRLKANARPVAVGGKDGHNNNSMDGKNSIAASPQRTTTTKKKSAAWSPLHSAKIGSGGKGGRYDPHSSPSSPPRAVPSDDDSEASVAVLLRYVGCGPVAVACGGIRDETDRERTKRLRDRGVRKGYRVHPTYKGNGEDDEEEEVDEEEDGSITSEEEEESGSEQTGEDGSSYDDSTLDTDDSPVRDEDSPYRKAQKMLRRQKAGRDPMTSPDRHRRRRRRGNGGGGGKQNDKNSPPRSIRVKKRSAHEDDDSEASDWDDDEEVENDDWDHSYDAYDAAAAAAATTGATMPRVSSVVLLDGVGVDPAAGGALEVSPSLEYDHHGETGDLGYEVTLKLLPPEPKPEPKPEPEPEPEPLQQQQQHPEQEDQDQQLNEREAKKVARRQQQQRQEEEEEQDDDDDNKDEDEMDSIHNPKTKKREEGTTTAPSSSSPRIGVLGDSDDDDEDDWDDACVGPSSPDEARSMSSSSSSSTTIPFEEKEKENDCGATEKEAEQQQQEEEEEDPQSRKEEKPTTIRTELRQVSSKESMAAAADEKEEEEDAAAAAAADDDDDDDILARVKRVKEQFRRQEAEFATEEREGGSGDVRDDNGKEKEGGEDEEDVDAAATAATAAADDDDDILARVKRVKEQLRRQEAECANEEHQQQEEEEEEDGRGNAHDSNCKEKDDDKEEDVAAAAAAAADDDDDILARVKRVKEQLHHFEESDDRDQHHGEKMPEEEECRAEEPLASEKDVDVADLVTKREVSDGSHSPGSSLEHFDDVLNVTIETDPDETFDEAVQEMNEEFGGIPLPQVDNASESLGGSLASSELKSTEGKVNALGCNEPSGDETSVKEVPSPTMHVQKTEEEPLESRSSTSTVEESPCTSNKVTATNESSKQPKSRGIIGGEETKRRILEHQMEIGCNPTESDQGSSGDKCDDSVVKKNESVVKNGMSSEKLDSSGLKANDGTSCNNAAAENDVEIGKERDHVCVSPSSMNSNKALGAPETSAVATGEDGNTPASLKMEVTSTKESEEVEESTKSVTTQSKGRDADDPAIPCDPVPISGDAMATNGLAQDSASPKEGITKTIPDTVFATADIGRSLTNLTDDGEYPVDESEMIGKGHNHAFASKESEAANRTCAMKNGINVIDDSAVDTKHLEDTGDDSKVAAVPDPSPTSVFDVAKVTSIVDEGVVGAEVKSVGPRNDGNENIDVERELFPSEKESRQRVPGTMTPQPKPAVQWKQKRSISSSGLSKDGSNVDTSHGVGKTDTLSAATSFSDTEASPNASSANESVSASQPPPKKKSMLEELQEMKAKMKVNSSQRKPLSSTSLNDPASRSTLKDESLFSQNLGISSASVMQILNNTKAHLK